MTTWLSCPQPMPDAAHRLVCFPHAGGAASFFRGWSTRLPGIEVHAVRYPGRAERIAEPPATDLRALAAEIATAVADTLGPASVALFGHSLGAVVALETGRALAELDVPVTHLFASGSHDGPLPPDDGVVEDDDDTIVGLLQLGGTPPDLAADPDFQELVLPYVRADSRMFHAYRHTAAPALDCPVTTIVGDADEHADRRPWHELTTRLTEHVLPGNHFYLLDEPPHAIITSAVTGQPIGATR